MDFQFVIDFETRSACNLTSAGADRYAEDPTTEIRILSYKSVRTGEIRRWYPGQAFPAPLANAHTLIAHNAAFEMAIWRHVMPRFCPSAPSVDHFSWLCTMKRAAYSGVPGALDRATVALNLDVHKDPEGHRLMMKQCKPRKPRKGEDPVNWSHPHGLYYHDDPAESEIVYNYCDQDCEAEFAVLRALPAPIPMETEVIRIDTEINSRGWKLDVDAASGGAKIASAAAKELNAQMRQETNGLISSTNQVAKILDFMAQHGVHLDSLRANEVRDKLADEGTEVSDFDGFIMSAAMPVHIRRILELRMEASKASARKLNAAVAGVSNDGTLKGLFAYSAAYRTGRWAGRRFQPHNLPRTGVPDGVDEDRWFEAMSSGNIDVFRTVIPEDMTVMDALKCSLRGVLTAREGKVLNISDLGQIEARGLAWLAGQADVVDNFFTYDRLVVAHGKKSDQAEAADIYSTTGAKMGLDRQGGKVAVLSCGYQAGRFTVQAFAQGYGISLSEDEADNIVQSWREANPAVVDYWQSEEAAAMQAMKYPGAIIDRGHTGAWCMKMGNLLRKLPSGRILVYRNAAIQPKVTPWGKRKNQIHYDANVYAKGQRGAFVRLSTYGGKIVENITQALCRDILAMGLIRARRAGLSAVGHVHDEQITEGDRASAEADCASLVTSMTQEIDWLPGFPLSASAETSFRYRK